jgi:SAM-dependent methyltransferase
VPYSAKTFDTFSAQVFKIAQPKRVLDIGCGAGKYAHMARASNPAMQIVGYEPESSYVERFNLRKVYDELRVASGEDLMHSPFEHFDLCIFGDSLEHFRKSVGADLVHFLLYRTKFIMIMCPIEYLQDPFEGVHTEAHISSWMPREFATYTDLLYLHDESAWLSLLRGFECSGELFESTFNKLLTVENGLKHVLRGNL